MEPPECTSTPNSAYFSLPPFAPPLPFGEASDMALEMSSVSGYSTNWFSFPRCRWYKSLNLEGKSLKPFSFETVFSLIGYRLKG
jgi:hypothetical protein